MYVERDFEERSFNRCCSGKAISNIYFYNVSVPLNIQHAISMRLIVVCGLSFSTTYFHIIS